MYKVLIVDDEASIRKGLGILIRWNDYGFEVGGEAENGSEALDRLKQESFDVLVSDIRMPKMNGLELIQEIDRMALNMRVILISGHRDFEYARSAIEFGVVNYVLKPINQELLIKTLLKIKEQCDSDYVLHGRAGRKADSDWRVGNAEIASRILCYIQENCCDNISLLSISRKFNYNHIYLGRLFFKFKGESFRDYLNRCRIKQAEKMIAEGKYKIYEISERVGYKDLNYFCKIFKKITGMTTGEYKSTQT